jgi:molybdenum cofactor synthesis domain-containing protein
MTVPRVAILVIGSEILSGDTEETNARFMARHLAAVGASLRRVVIVPDDLAEIARFAAELAAEHDVVFTCGGIGPTHDDVTYEGIARAFGAPLVLHPEIVTLIEAWKGGPLDPAHQRLARVPEGATLFRGDGQFPVVRVQNVIVLPGVPRLLQRKFPELLCLVRGEPVLTRQFRTDETELSLAAALSGVQSAHPEVEIGSYPSTPASGAWTVRLVLRCRCADPLERACLALVAAIPSVRELG